MSSLPKLDAALEAIKGESTTVVRNDGASRISYRAPAFATYAPADIERMLTTIREAYELLRPTSEPSCKDHQRCRWVARIEAEWGSE